MLYIYVLYTYCYANKKIQMKFSCSLNQYTLQESHTYIGSSKCIFVHFYPSNSLNTGTIHTCTIQFCLERLGWFSFLNYEFECSYGNISSILWIIKWVICPGISMPYHKQDDFTFSWFNNIALRTKHWNSVGNHLELRKYKLIRQEEIQATSCSTFFVLREIS